VLDAVVMRLLHLLAGHRQGILDRFVTRVRAAQSMGGREDLPRVVLLDGLPTFLDRLAEAVSELEDTGDCLEETSTAAAAVEHGQQRNDLGFEVAELVREYGILQDVILEMLCESSESCSLEEVRLIARHFGAASAEAVDHFVRARERERARLQAKHFGFLAHELRNKLAAAVATMGWWRRSQSTAELAVRTLDESLTDLTLLVDGELVTARLENMRGGVELVRERLAAADLIYAALKDVRPLAEARGVSIGTTADPGVSLDVDLRLVRAALANVLSNAVRLTPQGGRVEVRARTTSAMVVLEVEDQAGGLPEGFADRLFTPFAQAGKERHGHGLGLSIAREAVEVHGGRIAVESVAGKGCVFRLELPVR
jgi:signal transduction histidine kinase